MKTATMTVAVIAAALLSKDATGQVHQGVDLQVRFAPIAAVSGQLQYCATSCTLQTSLEIR